MCVPTFNRCAMLLVVFSLSSACLATRQPSDETTPNWDDLQKGPPVRYQMIEARFADHPTKEAAQVAAAESGTRVFFGETMGPVRSERLYEIKNRRLQQIMISVQTDSLSELYELGDRYVIVKVLAEDQ